MGDALYRRVMGEEFELLPPLLKRFHDGTTGSRGGGRFRVVREGDAIGAIIASLLRLPRPGDAIETTLAVHVEGDRERWVRCFGQQTMETTQWRSGDLLIERAGPLHLAFQLHGSPETMRFEWKHTVLLGLRLPRFLSIRVDGLVRCADERCWSVDVEIAVPLVGVITRYHGTLVLLP